MQNQTQPIDPTGKNLFTEYYEDDPYAGIQGQTAFLGLPELFGMITKGGITKQALKKAFIRDQISKQIGNKVGPIIKNKISGGGKKIITKKKKTPAPPGEKGGPGYIPPKKKYTPPSHQTGGSGGVHSGMKTTSSRRHKAPGGSGYGPHKKADGGLINFFKNGGYLG